MNTITVTIFVRHSKGCRYEGDRYAKRCDCRKHFEWMVDGVQYRKKAGTRSWEQAEAGKRLLEDQFAGRVSTTAKPDGGQPFAPAIKAFITQKETDGIGDSQLSRYTTELARFASFCERNGVFTTQLVTPDLVTDYKATWPELYESTYTRREVQKRLLAFLKLCVYRDWLDRVPRMSTVRITEPPTEPLTETEFQKLLGAIPKAINRKPAQQRMHALIMLMRWSGLAVRDASGLRRDRLRVDEKANYAAVPNFRRKLESTGTRQDDVWVPIPLAVGLELQKVANGNPKYLFWNPQDGNTSNARSARFFSEQISAVFDAAGIESAGHMVGHRLRDTFACDLLQKGVSVEDVSKLLGHKSIRTTEIAYAKWIKGRQDRLTSVVMATFT